MLQDWDSQNFLSQILQIFVTSWMYLKTNDTNNFF
jgi:hypothetical protein